MYMNYGFRRKSTQVTDSVSSFLDAGLYTVHKHFGSRVMSLGTAEFLGFICSWDRLITP